MLAGQDCTREQESAETMAARETARHASTVDSSFEARQIAAGLGEMRLASDGEDTTRREPSFCFVTMLWPFKIQSRSVDCCMHLSRSSFVTA